MAKTIKEMIEVMEWFDNGEDVEVKGKNEEDTEWILASTPSWNWDAFDYRIKKQKVTIEKWLIGDNNIQVVVETSDIDSWLESFPTSQKLKLIESYEVEI